MNEYVKDQIINNNYHQFLYGYNTEERTNFLKEIARDYPLTLNRNCPQAIYMEDFSLPVLEDNNKTDRSLLEIAGKYYFEFSIYY